MLLRRRHPRRVMREEYIDTIGRRKVKEDIVDELVKGGMEKEEAVEKAHELFPEPDGNSLLDLASKTVSTAYAGAKDLAGSAVVWIFGAPQHTPFGTIGSPSPKEE